MTLRITFFHSDKPRERILSDAFARGVAASGDFIELRRLTPEVENVDCDVAVMVGVKSRELYRHHFDLGQHVVMIDKGYTRHAAPGPVKVWEYWRFAVDGHHPTAILSTIQRPDDRLDGLGLVLQPWRVAPNGPIVLAGSSQKYHDFYGLREPTSWAQKLVRQIRQVSQRQIIYRPKPSWREAIPIEDTVFSAGDQSIDDVLKGAHALITHGSNACFEAVIAGVPSVILGNGVALPISSSKVEDIEQPRLATYGERHQWLANIAYCQWTLPEIADGKAWEALRPQIYR